MIPSLLRILRPSIPRSAASPTAYNTLPLWLPIPRTVLFEVRVGADPAVVASEDKDSMDRLLCVKRPFMVDTRLCCRWELSQSDGQCR